MRLCRFYLLKLELFTLLLICVKRSSERTTPTFIHNLLMLQKSSLSHPGINSALDRFLSQCYCTMWKWKLPPSLLDGHHSRVYMDLCAPKISGNFGYLIWFTNKHACVSKYVVVTGCLNFRWWSRYWLCVIIVIYFDIDLTSELWWILPLLLCFPCMIALLWFFVTNDIRYWFWDWISSQNFPASLSQRGSGL